MEEEQEVGRGRQGAMKVSGEKEIRECAGIGGEKWKEQASVGVEFH